MKKLRRLASRAEGTYLSDDSIPIPMNKNLFLGLICLISMTGVTLAQDAAKQAAKQKFHEFDFWIGEWDVYKSGTDTLVGQSVIQSIIDSMAIQENYHAVGGSYEGKSLNKYNPFSARWEQFWVDNTGLTLHIGGGYADGKMIMGSEAGTLSNRITWHNNPDGTVRQVWEQSTDKGENWQLVFDGTYKRKKN